MSFIIPGESDGGVLLEHPSVHWIPHDLSFYEAPQKTMLNRIDELNTPATVV